MAGEVPVVGSAVIRQVKGRLDEDKTVIVDIPPGTSCPVVESVRGTDFCLLVTEPTPFGLYDLSLALEVVRELGIPAGVVLNRAGSGDAGMEEYCREQRLPLLMKVPLDRRIAELYSRGVPLVQGMPQWKAAFVSLFRWIERTVSDGGGKKSMERARGYAVPHRTE